MKWYLEREKTREIIQEFDNEDEAEISAMVYLFGFGELVNVIGEE